MHLSRQEHTCSVTCRPGPLRVILVAITHVGIRETLVQALADETRYVVLAVSSSPDALEATRDCVPDLLILDYYLSPGGGLALSDQLHSSQRLRQVPTIILSDRRPHEVREIDQRGLLSLGQPFDLADLESLLDLTLPTSSPRCILWAPLEREERGPGSDSVTDSQRDGWHQNRVETDGREGLAPAGGDSSPAAPTDRSQAYPMTFG